MAPFVAFVTFVFPENAWPRRLILRLFLETLNAGDYSRQQDKTRFIPKGMLELGVAQNVDKWFKVLASTWEKRYRTNTTIARLKRVKVMVQRPRFSGSWLSHVSWPSCRSLTLRSLILCVSFVINLAIVKCKTNTSTDRFLLVADLSISTTISLDRLVPFWFSLVTQAMCKVPCKYWYYVYAKTKLLSLITNEAFYMKS